MAATITASMAGELARKVSAPSKPDKNVDEKFGKLKSSLDDLSKKFDPNSTEYIKEQDTLIERFKEEIGFNDFPIIEQKATIEKINKDNGTNYDALIGMQKELNNSSSMLYKNMGQTINVSMEGTLKKSKLEKNIIQQLSDNIKNKIQNISPIKTTASFFTNIKSSLTSLYKKQDTANSLIDNIAKTQKESIRSLSIDMRTMSEEQMIELKNKMDPKTFEAALLAYEKHKKITDYPFGSLLISMGDSVDAFGDKLNRTNTMMKLFSDPIKLIKDMFEVISQISSVIFRTLVPTIISMAITFFTVVLPTILLVIAAVVLIIIILYLLWKHFGKYIKMLWGFIKEYVVDYFIMVFKVVKEVLFFVWDLIKLAWGIIVDIYDFIDAIFSGDFVGAGKIIVRLMDRIVDFILKTFEHLFNIFQYFGEFLSKLPIIGPVFKFLFAVFMPFMRFFIEAFKWIYSFIKDTISMTWNNLIDTFKLIKAIFSGDFKGAGVIIKGMFDRVKNFIVDKVLSVLTIFQTLGKKLFGVVDMAFEYIEHIFDIFQNFGAFLSKLPIIGSIFKFLSDIFMPFMRYFIDEYKWLYSFIKDGVSVVWNNLVDTFKLIKAIFSGDFQGAGVIIKGMFDRVKNFIVDKVLSYLVILQKLGNSLLVPIMWLWDVFKVAWEYFYKLVSPIFDWIWNTLKAGWDFIYGIIKNIWDFLSNPAKMIASAAKAVGNVVKESFSAVTDKLSSWGSSVVDAINPMNWFAEGKIALEPIKAVVGEAGPEAAIPLDDAGLEFLKKTFNIDDNSFSSMINNSDLYSVVLDIKDQTIEIKKVVDDIESKISDMGKPTFFESVSQSYTNMFNASPTTSDNKSKKENPGETIMKKLNEIQKLIENMSVGEGSTSNPTKDSEMDILKLIASGMMGRR